MASPTFILRKAENTFFGLTCKVLQIQKLFTAALCIHDAWGEATLDEGVHLMTREVLPRTCDRSQTSQSEAKVQQFSAAGWKQWLSDIVPRFGLWTPVCVWVQKAVDCLKPCGVFSQWKSSNNADHISSVLKASVAQSHLLKYRVSWQLLQVLQVRMEEMCVC